MPKRKPSRLQLGAELNGWRVVEELNDYAYAERRVSYQRVRVECLTCQRSLMLKATEVERLACSDCAKVTPVAATLTPLEIEERILYAYRVHLKICSSMYLAPTSFERFAEEIRANPDDLLEDAPPQREAAQYERRDYSPLYTSE